MDENEAMKHNIKSTKISEIEVEMKMYIDECTRLRHQLEEVIKSKDTFADPEELKIIEGKFQQQDILIGNLKNENTELANAYSQRDEENLQLRQLLTDVEKRFKKAAFASKEAIKSKKLAKEKEKDNGKLKMEVAVLRQQSDEQRMRIEDLIKRS